MPGIKVIITGATGMVGEGVLFECLKSPEIEHILLVSRSRYPLDHPKVSQLLLPDFSQPGGHEGELSGYEACLFCAGVSSLGKSEALYTRITHDMTLSFAAKLASLNPGMRFVYVSGAHTDSTEQGKSMWARVKGRTENALLRLPFGQVYNFRPGLMRASEGQKNAPWLYRVLGNALYPLLKAAWPNSASTLSDVGVAMIKAVRRGYPKPVLEVADINALAKSSSSFSPPPAR